MKEFFKKEDFGFVEGEPPNFGINFFATKAADLANSKLTFWLESAPTLYQYRPGSAISDWSPYIDEEYGGRKRYIRQGRVVCVEELKEEKNEKIDTRA